MQENEPPSGCALNGLDGNRTRGAALEQAQRGWSIFPTGTPSGGSHGHGLGSHKDCERCDAEKAPRRGWRWKQRNSSDPAVIAAHWPADGPNIGVACLPSRLVVIDLDTTAHGAELTDEWRLPGISDGADVFAHLLEQNGQGWPSTHIVRTASGGLHLYYRAIAGRPIPNSQSKVGPMIDVRGDGNSDGTPGGGYVLGVGSVVGGSQYEVIDDSDPLPLPEWLANLADPPKAAQPIRSRPTTPTSEGARPHSRMLGLLDTILNAPVGQRNSVLHWASCRVAEMIHEGHVDRQAGFVALAQAGEAIGLSDREVQATIGSAFGRAAA